MRLARNCCPRKYEPPSVMIASRLRSCALNNTCWVLGLTSSRSIFHFVADSVYVPAILKLLAASRLPPAPLLSARMVGSPSPKGRSHADSITMTAAAPAAHPTDFNNLPL